MIAGWWLEQNPEFDGFDDGAEWLLGFRSRLKDEELDGLDLEHIKELTAWHDEQETERAKDNEKQHDRVTSGAAETQPLAGPSSLAM